jgi:tetratricopeptide (TPR) repeat protein
MKKIIVVLIFIFAVVTPSIFGQTTADDWFKKANEYFYSGDYTNAIIAYNETIKRDNSIFFAYFYRSLSHYNLNNYDKAISDCTDALKISSFYDNVWLFRGYLYYLKKEYDKAIADIEAALRINPNYPNANETLEEIKKEKLKWILNEGKDKL